MFAGNASSFSSVLYSNIYRSSNNGSNWNLVYSFSGSTTVKDFESIGNTVLAAYDSGVLRSSDNGNTWANSNNGLPPNTKAFSFAKNNNVIYTGTNNGVFLTADSAATWQPLNDSLGDLYVSAIAIKNNILYAGTFAHGVWSMPINGLQALQNHDGLIPKINIYPNPSCNVIYIDFNDQPLQDATVAVIDITGKILSEKKIITQDTSININELPVGIYILKVTNRSNTQNFRFIKE
jgi:hypothetical protein